MVHRTKSRSAINELALVIPITQELPMGQTPYINNTEKESKAQRSLGGRACLTKTVLGLCLFCMGLGTACDATVLAGPPSTLSLSMHNQQMSAHIIRAPLESVLATLTMHGPFRFIIKGNAKNDLISSSFRHFSLKESLETLLLGYDYAIIHRRIDPVLQTSEFPYIMEVVVLSRNPAEPSAGEARPSLISSQKTSTHPLLLQASKNLGKSDQAIPLSLVTENDARDIQEILEKALLDADPEARILVKELLQE